MDLIDGEQFVYFFIFFCLFCGGEFQIVVEGCVYGYFDDIYVILQYLERVENVKIDFFICCGDFQVCCLVNVWDFEGVEIVGMKVVLQ